ncbi:MAG: ribonuclease P protein component [Paracoccaceae bacterium]
MTPAPVLVVGEKAGAASVRLAVMRHRAEFLKAAKAKHQSTAGFVLQARERAPNEPGNGIRVGYTCSKKVGNAVARNRAKRRLREIARQILPDGGVAGWDYVLIGRATATAQRRFTDLSADLQNALTKIHRNMP